ncbi:endonuclease/exonuclease/phosphatase family protein [Limibacillus sp. MBR-115]|jgi:endonuclease/exonuclease/phosphatase family metal-dependent hydrolase|uniref:endonuclease/exonuclease/phosphatase family protein n=1 Tax=Limibacillus sp. MBR-115 TaxID=3156465 RepID=UPI0033957255
MEIVTWNIQFGLGTDGIASLERIAARILEKGRPEVVCLQEVARFLPSLGPCAAGDQVAALAALFDGYRAVYGPAIERQSASGVNNRTLEFGNLILSRLPVIQVFRHPLPQPAAAGVKHMPRQATEVVVQSGEHPLRIITTHLEFHSEPQRKAQVERLKALQQEAHDNERLVAATVSEGPYAAVPRPQDAIVCGDFNAEPNDAVYRAMLSSIEGRSGNLFQDAWRVLKGDAPHDGTCGLDDPKQWPQGLHCRDYFFVSERLAAGLVDIWIDQETCASDHLPVWLRLYPTAAKPEP